MSHERPPLKGEPADSDADKDDASKPEPQAPEECDDGSCALPPER